MALDINADNKQADTPRVRAYAQSWLHAAHAQPPELITNHQCSPASAH